MHQASGNETQYSLSSLALSIHFQAPSSHAPDLHNSTKKNEIALAKVGLTIVLIFILCHSVKWIPNIYELVRLSTNNKRQWPSWIESITHVAHFLMSVNSSANFYVYCAKHFKCPFFSKSNSNGIVTEASASTRIMLTSSGNSTAQKTRLMVQNGEEKSLTDDVEGIVTGTMV